ncbi:hypothetical protein NE237_023612 [Protea cynaroides]|uniref:Uncharacterized protein n=1 Tax=Protea cynaroides TaxID=273540 RepID=A0A9Q0HCG2_9MAGN|nr:hypothetical protein NE237_023612 [Protea cynaroides]
MEKTIMLSTFMSPTGNRSKSRDRGGQRLSNSVSDYQFYQFHSVSHGGRNHNHRSSQDVWLLCHRTFQSFQEHASVQIEYGTSQSGTSNNPCSEISSSRASRLRITRNDRLPGTVQLTRERLVERLRGVSLSGNRQGGRTSSGISWDDFATSSDFRLVDTGDLEREWSSLSVCAPQTGLSSLLGLSYKKPPGLSR